MGDAVLTVLLSFSVVYLFAPDLRDPEWRRSTRGALCAPISGEMNSEIQKAAAEKQEKRTLS